MPSCYAYMELKEKMLVEILSKKRKIGDVADILSISRQSVSKWLAQYRLLWIEGITPRKPWPKSTSIPYNKVCSHLESLVIEISKRDNFVWPIGIRDTLLTETWEILNQSTIYRILKRTQTRYFTGYHWARKKRKLYVKDIPGRELQVDASFPWGYQRNSEWICPVIFTAIDDASRTVYSSIFENHNEQSVLMFLSELISRVPYPIEAIRTDQWREYSKKVQDFLTINHIEHNKNPAYTPQHNGKVERYHRTMKENCTDFWKWNDDIETYRYSLKLWTDYYNWTKKHYWLGMAGATPSEKLKEFKQSFPYLMPTI
jgi:transposase InsO family protein